MYSVRGVCIASIFLFIFAVLLAADRSCGREQAVKRGPFAAAAERGAGTLTPAGWLTTPKTVVTLNGKHVLSQPVMGPVHRLSPSWCSEKALTLSGKHREHGVKTPLPRDGGEGALQ